MSKFLKMVQSGMAVLMNRGKGFDLLAKPVQVVSATEDGKLIFEWTVNDDQINGFGTLHGGYTSFMVDLTTTAALMAIGSKPGVSIDLSVSYLKAAKVGEVVVMETDIKKVGSRLAFLEATLKNKQGDLLATGKHTKFVG